MNDLKQKVAEAALAYVPQEGVLGVGSGSTVNAFIEALSRCDLPIEGVVAASKASEDRLRDAGIRVMDLNSVASLPLYIDGADAIGPQGFCLKGGGGAMTSEKIMASMANRFLCVVDQSKVVTSFQGRAVAIEVIAQARSMVARKCVAMGGNPVYREGFVSDHGHVVLDVYDLPMADLSALDTKLNAIAGIVGHGIFIEQAPNLALIASAKGVDEQSFK